MMTREFLEDKISLRFPALEMKDESGLIKIDLSADQLIPFMKFMQEMGVEHLSTITCVDWLEYFEMVYILVSQSYKERFIIKVKLEDREDPEIDTLVSLWKSADFYEREVYDMFGVKFKGHPDLRRILLDDDWKGFPLRKDYDDPVNIIPL